MLRARGYDVITHSRSDEAHYQVDLAHPKNTRELFDEVQPHVIINLAGLTNVDTCEESPNKAYLANVRVVENIAAWIKDAESMCHLVQISTDQVYDGSGLHEESLVTLENCYAFSKYAGELAAANVPSTILRTNFFGSSQCAKRVSLTDWLYHSLSNSAHIQVFDDVLFNPISMATLSEMIELVIREKPVGVFNLGSHEGMSKADFAFSFAGELGFSTGTMTRTSTDQAAFLNAYRPKDMRMDCSKFEDTLKIKLPHLKEEIKRVSRDYCET
jgi:dTDP-4-dehydrorhamnose reductase